MARFFLLHFQWMPRKEVRPKAATRATYKIACRCGERFVLDSRSFGRPRVCRSCGASLTVAWGRDPLTRQAVPVAVNAAPERPDAARFPFVAVCGCGYSRPATPEESRKVMDCPGCGKAMAVEKAPDPKVLEKLRKPVAPPQGQPLLPLRLRPPARVRVQPNQRTFECLCGERLWIRPGVVGQSIQCFLCDRHHIIEAEAAPSPVLPAKASAPPRPRTSVPAPKPAPPPRVLHPGEVACACGAIIPPRTSRTGRTFACTACGRKGHVEDVIDPAIRNVALKAVFTIEPPIVPPRPGPSQDGSLPPAAVTHEEPMEKAAAIPSDAEITICKCGTELFVSSDDIGHAIQCPACGILMTVEPLPDPERGGATLRIRLLQKMDEWSMDDFSADPGALLEGEGPTGPTSPAP